jgi:hypothetical protein
MQKETAKQLTAIMLECCKKLDDSIVLVTDSCVGEESMQFRRAAGKIMGHIFVDILDPIYREHPELEPDDLKSQRR